ncbi:histidine kinase [Aureimonas sp. Leaf454]|uniref:ATP-binding protein n=1 Tax=Aureimonas sp. Leaf454 TaxID=1736381 RepID=UPI0006F4E12F|nr:HAMP domain-containing sensor histidine kinase [Aureimonas sp. Leaf454]KQT54239.1 histidine kinase [Aureimonas sp. Leaf454]
MKLRAFDSLAVRVIAFSSLWAITGLVVVGGLISTIYGRTASRGFEELLVAQLYNIVNVVSVSPEGNLSGSPDLGDLRYSQPLSGWYWEVLPASDNTKGRLASISLGPADIASPSTALLPFDPQYRRDYEARGLEGEALKVVETEIVLDQDNHIARFRVMGNASLVQADIDQFDQTLFFYLSLFGLGSILINAVAILYGLKPLTSVRRSLGEVRNGRAERLMGAFPAEIRPLTVEMNALIDNNRRIVERARTQVGNLAHSLKTPIAVLMNEAEAMGGDKGRLFADQGDRMRHQVQHYLDRARIAAQSEGIVFRTPVQSTLERLARVLVKLNPKLRFEFAGLDAKPLVFAGERQDYEEMVGNLLENAAKWTRGRIRLSVAPLGDGTFRTSVEDDGPGLDEADAAEAVKRGRRLDEEKPGSGLGLSIVIDTAEEYRGTFTLSRSSIGGLCAALVLPLALDPETS